MIELKTQSDMACEILQKTNDGDDLDPKHLYLVQEWVNENLNEYGKQLFRELHAQVAAGTYVKPWFHGIEHLTRNHHGYVFWKGVEIEHYSFSGKDAWEREEEAAIELARRCLLLEALYIQPTCKRVIWRWSDDYEQDSPHLGNAENLPRDLQKAGRR
jgi:hypothetical protein